MKVSLKTDRTALGLNIPDDNVIDILDGQPVHGIEHRAIQRIISNGMRDYFPDTLPLQKIAVIIPDNTRLWARGDLFVPHILKALLDRGVEPAQVKIIIALGTHKELRKDRFAHLAGDFSVQHVEILNSANADRSRLVYFGETTRKTPLYFTKEAADADHIIIFGGILHHLIAGFGGGRKYIAPGIAGYETVQRNHALAIQSDGTSHPMVRPGQLIGNPIHEDATEAADIFLKNKTCTYVAFRLIDVLKRFRVSLVSGIDEGDVRQMGFIPVEDLEQYVCQLSGRGYIIPSAENVLPVLDVP
jgi:nickel-dependent lactate racemase